MIKPGMVLMGLGCAAAFGGWPTYHGGADLRGVADASVPARPERLWRYNAGGEISSTPVSDGERIFFCAKRGRVLALDLTGKKLWERSFSRINDAGQNMPRRFEAPLVCAAGRVFAGSAKGTLFALDAATGKTQWQYETEGIITGSPNILHAREDAGKQRNETLGMRSKIIVLDQSEGALHSIDVKTGKQVWKTEGVERCDGAPGVGGGRIVFGSCLAALHVYDIGGKHLKDVEIGGDGQIAGGVAVEGALAFAGLRDGALICVDLEKGAVVWSSEESEDQTFSTPVVTKGLVLYASDDGFVYAVGKSDGELVWKFDTGGLPYSAVVAGEQVVVSADGILYVLKLADGTRLWSNDVSDEITAPAIINEMVVVGADEGTVTAFGAQK